jgi:hypothetical protein
MNVPIFLSFSDMPTKRSLLLLPLVLVKIGG